MATVADEAPADATVRVAPTTSVSGSPLALLASVGALMVGAGLMQSLLGVRGQAEGFGTAVLGVLMSGYFAGYLLGSLTMPGLISAVGHIRAFTALGSIASAAFVVHGVFVDPAPWLVLRIVSGACTAGLVVVAESWLNVQSTNETRGRLLSIYMVVIYVGQAAGQLLLNAADPGGLELFVVVSVVVSLSVVPVAITRLPGPEQMPRTTVRLRTVVDAAPVALVGAATSGLAQSALLALGVVYARSAGLTVAAASLFMTAVLGSSVVLTIPIGRLSDRRDRRLVLAVTAASSAAIAAVAAALDSTQLAVLVALGALHGMVSFALYPVSAAHLNDRLEAHQVVDAGAKLIVVYAVGAAAGPVVASSSMVLIGQGGFWWYQAVVAAVLAVYAAYRLTRPVPDEQKVEFAPYPLGVTPAIVGGTETEGSSATAFPARQFSVDADDVTLVVDRVGDGESVVLVHGLGAGRRMWRSQRDALAEAGFAGIAYDLRGHGDSMAAARYRLEDHVADLAAVIGAAGGGPVHLVGSGFGGLIALRLAERDAAAVRSIVLVGALGSLPPRRARERLAERAAVAVDRAVAPVRGRRRRAEHVAAAYYDRRREPERFGEVRDAVLDASPAAEWEGRFEVLGSPTPTPPPGVPILVVSGTADRAAAARARALDGRLDSMQFRVVGGAGTFVQLDEPEALARLLVRFLNGDAAGAAASGAGDDDGAMRSV